MRLFVAIELPERLRIAVADLGSRLAPKLPKASWVRASNLHLTLAFLGELTEHQLPALAKTLVSSAEQSEPFSLQVEGAGCFPPSGRSRVAWLGFSTSRTVLDLQRKLVAGLRSSIGFDTGDRDFAPHLTVARCNPPWPRAAAQRWQESLPGTLGETFPVRSFALIQSRLDRTGAVYRTLQRFSLGAAT